MSLSANLVIVVCLAYVTLLFGVAAWADRRTRQGRARFLQGPLVYVFNQPITHFGVPQVVIYLFVVWLLLIMGTAMLTHLLPPETGDTTNGPEAD